VLSNSLTITHCFRRVDAALGGHLLGDGVYLVTLGDQVQPVLLGQLDARVVPKGAVEDEAGQRQVGGNQGQQRLEGVRQEALRDGMSSISPRTWLRFPWRQPRPGFGWNANDGASGTFSGCFTDQSIVGQNSLVDRGQSEAPAA
jgi:hypothetical protein